MRLIFSFCQLEISYANDAQYPMMIIGDKEIYMVEGSSSITNSKSRVYSGISKQRTHWGWESCPL